MTAMHGMSVDVQTPDGVADAYVAYPDDGAAHPGVLVIQDGFGLRPSLRSLADRIAAHGYNRPTSERLLPARARAGDRATGLHRRGGAAGDLPAGLPDDP